ncbi:hypothetical protein FGL86_04700 [Pistricoccus aurantiacus]|uniref:Uncharacterized protein n=1 Tax=Pistricoccus aurantiacus TaxID=1883414 RepID=A0A5B8SSI9_9GAMM|nr:hypothetical protein [Pistricoccus aurantiacus]QEA38445.1 hypothetical protein FGL86_04700 [Pistricoccus aurantiacus]
MKLEDTDETLDRVTAAFDAALARLTQAHQIEPKPSKAEVLALAREMIIASGGLGALHARVAAMEAAGVFADSDWDRPAILQPALAVRSLRQGEPDITAIEALSEIRLLAVALSDYFHPGISAEQARNFLTQVMALNLDLLAGPMSEADRERPQALGKIVQALYQYLLAHLGYESILESLVDEIQRLLAQRPIQTDSIKQMISQIAQCLFDPEIDTAGTEGAARLVRALFGPTAGCRDDPGLEVYAQRLAAMGETALIEEASSFAQAMHDTGLVSPYHPLLLRYLRGRRDDLVLVALGLSSTGCDTLLCYQELVHSLIDEALFPETSQAVYGLALLLERGALFSVPIASGLWRQIRLTLSVEASNTLRSVFGEAHPPRVFLLAGVLSLLGQPLGVGQGNNPTCQSVIGLSMWADNDGDYLLQLLAWAARDNEVLSRFEGERISSKSLEAGLAKAPPLDVDPVSLVLIPHLDRLYMEMGRLCGERGDDLHRWINPEFYGWWVGQGFRVAADIHTGKLDDYDGFIRHFYACYHPFYNGNMPLIHPQPAGIVVTDSAARLVGRHAITLLRVALDASNEMRAYFFNPNNDSGQDWGQGIICAIQGNGERHGEASLPIAEFASRLYVFHYDPLEVGDRQAVPADEVARIIELGKGSWAADG